MTAIPQLGTRVPQLRLFREEEPAAASVPIATKEPTYTLDLYFSGPYASSMKARKLAPATVSDYRTHVRYFAEFCEYRMAYPVLADIDAGVLEVFQEYLRDVQKIDGRTLNKCLDTIVRVLKHAFRRGLIRQTPVVDPVHFVSAENRFVFSDLEIERLYRTAHTPAWPGHWYSRRGDVATPLPLPLSDYLRCWLVLERNCGFRVGDLWPTKPTHRPVCWGNIRWETRQRFFGKEFECEFGWLVFSPLKTRRKGVEIVIPLNRVMAAHLRAIEPPGGGRPDAPIFNFPRVTNRNTRAGRVGFYPTWWSWLSSAGLLPELASDGSRTTHNPEDFRNTANTLHEDHHGVGDFVTHGRSRASTGKKHYYNPIARLIESFSTLPQPDCFDEVFHRERRQRLLF